MNKVLEIMLEKQWNTHAGNVYVFDGKIPVNLAMSVLCVTLHNAQNMLIIKNVKLQYRITDNSQKFHVFY